MARIAICITVAWLGALGPALAQAPAPATSSPATRNPALPPTQRAPAAPSTVRPGAPPNVTTNPPAAAPRVARSYQVCTREAQARRYRGAERRHFVSRCQLGYGFRLFRRRGQPPNVGPSPGAPNPAGTPPAANPG